MVTLIEGVLAVKFSGILGLFHGFPGPMLFPGLSEPGNLSILISGLSRVCINPAWCLQVSVSC